MLKKLIFITLFLVLTSCGGSDDSSNAAPTSPPITPPTSDAVLYFGHYSEDPSSDPNDPTSGIVYVYLPTSDNTFNGEFFFSYVGCEGSYDTGKIVASLSGSHIDGTWSGDIDGFTSTGTFTAASTDNNITFTGVWARNGGSTTQDFGACSYTIAGNGDIALYEVAGTAFTIDVDLSNPFVPVFSWTATSPATRYKLDVFDKACLEAGGTIDTCLMWSDIGFDAGGGLPSAITYGAGIYPAKNLINGSDYVVTYLTYDHTGVIVDFGSNVFSVQ